LFRVVVIIEFVVKYMHSEKLEMRYGNNR